MAADFEKQSYWHDRFASETSFEWLLSSSRFMSEAEPFMRHLNTRSRVLQIGSGTSDLHNHFRSRGILNVTNIDYEPLAADRGMELEKNVFGDVKMNYAVADATQLEREEEERGYDLVVDKSTCDAIACGGDEQVKGMVNSVRRCLADRGVWISLSFSKYRYDMDDLPLKVDLISQILTPKAKPTEPDVYHYCYLLQPKDVTRSGSTSSSSSSSSAGDDTI